MAEHKFIAALEAETQEKMDVEATEFEVNNEIFQNGQEMALESRRLDCIYGDESLGFEKYPFNFTKWMQAQDALEEIDLGDGLTKRPTYISSKLNLTLKERVIKMLKEFKDCFA